MSSAALCRWPLAAAVAVALALLAPALLAFGAWVAVAPAPGHWTVPLALRVAGVELPLRASVPKLLHAATDPTLARWLDGRALASPIGPLALRWHDDSRALMLHCAPCTFASPMLGDAPLRLAELSIELRRAGDGRYAGRLASGAVVLPFVTRAQAGRLAIDAALPPTRIAELVALLGDAVPEARRGRIDGTLAFTATVELPRGRWAVEPVFEGFAVDGLGTQALVHARPPSACRPLTRAVSPWLERAVIAAEDQRFAEHAGYDLIELRRALRGDPSLPDARRPRGASTITQQLARLAVTGDERSVARKARELLYAVEMERTLGKGRILRLYLAMAPWGDGICGAEAAARHWFGRGAAALDAEQAAWLALKLRAPLSAADPASPERMKPVMARLK